MENKKFTNTFAIIGLSGGGIIMLITMLCAHGLSLGNSFPFFPNVGTAIVTFYCVAEICWAVVAYYWTLYITEKKDVKTIRLNINKEMIENQIGVEVDDFYVERDRKNGGVKIFVKPVSVPEYINVPIIIQKVG